MKILKILTISLISLSCHNKQEEIKNIISSQKGKKWYYYGITEYNDYYPARVLSFYSDGSMNKYLRYRKNGQLDKIPYDDVWNTEKWFIINDSIISISSSRNPITGYYDKNKSKILYLNQDTIILQNHHKNIVILINYDKFYEEIETDKASNLMIDKK